MPLDVNTWARTDLDRRARARRRKAKAYRYLLPGAQEWQTYIGVARNVKSATAAIADVFGVKPVAVRVHPISDPWPHPMPDKATPIFPDRAA